MARSARDSYGYARQYRFTAMDWRSHAHHCRLQCLRAAPDVFDLPDGSDQVVLIAPDPEPTQYDAVLRAAAMCPSQALRVGDP